MNHQHPQLRFIIAPSGSSLSLTRSLSLATAAARARAYGNAQTGFSLVFRHGVLDRMNPRVRFTTNIVTHEHRPDPRDVVVETGSRALRRLFAGWSASWCSPPACSRV